MKYNMLIVDDEQANLRLLQRVFSPEYTVITAESGAAALEVLEKQPVALIISDQRMPGMTGIEFLKRAAMISPQSVRIILTGYTDAEALVEAVNSGAVYKYVTKPWINSDLKVTVQRGLQHHETLKAQRSLQESYTRVLLELDEARSSYGNFARAILQLQDPVNYARAVRLTTIAAKIARDLELQPSEAAELHFAILIRALLNVGGNQENNKTTKPVDSLHAVRKFDDGMQAMEKVPFTRKAIGSVRHFSEHYDGSGKPSGLLGNGIPLISRIGAVVTAFDDMTSPGTYGPPIDPAAALEIIRDASGSKFDPQIVEIFINLRKIETVAGVVSAAVGDFRNGVHGDVPLQTSV